MRRGVRAKGSKRSSVGAIHISEKKSMAVFRCLGLLEGTYTVHSAAYQQVESGLWKLSIMELDALYLMLMTRVEARS